MILKEEKVGLGPLVNNMKSEFEIARENYEQAEETYKKLKDEFGKSCIRLLIVCGIIEPSSEFKEIHWIKDGEIDLMYKVDDEFRGIAFFYNKDFNKTIKDLRNGKYTRNVISIGD